MMNSSSKKDDFRSDIFSDSNKFECKYFDGDMSDASKDKGSVASSLTKGNDETHCRSLTKFRPKLQHQPSTKHCIQSVDSFSSGQKDSETFSVELNDDQHSSTTPAAVKNISDSIIFIPTANMSEAKEKGEVIYRKAGLPSSTMYGNIYSQVNKQHQNYSHTPNVTDRPTEDSFINASSEVPSTSSVLTERRKSSRSSILMEDIAAASIAASRNSISRISILSPTQQIPYGGKCSRNSLVRSCGSGGRGAVFAKSESKEETIPMSIEYFDGAIDDSSGFDNQKFSRRLAARKTILEKRRRISDYALVSGIIGIVIMVMENELCSAGLYLKIDPPSIILKSLISISTVILLYFVLHYHYLDLKLFSVDNCAEDWQIAIDLRRIFQVTVEIFVCGIHPFPGQYYFIWTTKLSNQDGRVGAQLVPIDIALSLPMFLRLYLICRVMLLHSKLFTDVSSRSIGALNRISFNTRFVLKTLMTICPGTMLLVIMVSLWIIASWTLRQCERYHDAQYNNILNSLWLVAITFLCVGYGDIVPNTYCGRAICLFCGIMGASCTALLVAVVSKKLELSPAEKHVHNFMMNTQLSKRLKSAAANVLRETWLMYKYKKRSQHSKIRKHNRKFLIAIYQLRKVKMEQRKLMDNSSNITDIVKKQNMNYDILSLLNQRQDITEESFTSIDSRIETLQNSVDLLVDLIKKRLEQPNLNVIHPPLTMSGGEMNGRSFVHGDGENPSHIPLHSIIKSDDNNNNRCNNSQSLTGQQTSTYETYSCSSPTQTSTTAVKQCTCSSPFTTAVVGDAVQSGQGVPGQSALTALPHNISSAASMRQMTAGLSRDTSRFVSSSGEKNVQLVASNMVDSVAPGTVTGVTTIGSPRFTDFGI